LKRVFNWGKKVFNELKRVFNWVKRAFNELKRAFNWIEVSNEIKESSANR